LIGIVIVLEHKVKQVARALQIILFQFVIKRRGHQEEQDPQQQQQQEEEQDQQQDERQVLGNLMHDCLSTPPPSPLSSHSLLIGAAVTV
jgi:hypothetical protein